MKKILLTFAFILVAVSTWAVKADPRPITVTQIDGKQLTIVGHGNSDFHWLSTTDGVLLLMKNGAYYVASVNADGTLSMTNQLAHNSADRSEEEKLLIEKQNKELFFNQGEAKAKKSKAKRVGASAMMKAGEIQGSTLFPHKGSPKAVVILVQFQDLKFTLPDPKKSFEQYLNAGKNLTNYGNRENSNFGSVKEYFKDMSFGSFTPQFDVYGPVTVSRNLAYYGGSDPNGDDEQYLQLMKEACELADNDIDFTQYAFAEGSKNVLVYIIYAGYSQSQTGNSNDCIWPKSWSGITKTFDGMTIARCGINNELIGHPGCWSSEPLKRINGIGLFCHEFSHCMGLPDFYPTIEDAQVNNQALEFWSIMDGGEYVNNGYYPTAYTAWEREAFGWMNIETLSENTQSIQLNTIDNDGKAYRIYNDNDDSKNEYYIVQNIQKQDWNLKLDGHGMLVFHVNYNATAFSNNTVNNVKGSPRMTIVPADGILSTSYKYDMSQPEEVKKYKQDMAGDPYPGTNNVTTLSDESGIVNFKPYKGNQMNKFFTNISESDGIISFDFYNGTPSSIQDIPLANGNNDSRIFTLDGRYAGTDINTLPKGIYIMGKKKVYVK